VGEEQEMWGGGGMWVRSDVTSGRNRRWEWRPDAGDAEDEKTTSDASGRGARASDAGLIFADACNSATLPPMHPNLNLNTIAHQDSPLPLILLSAFFFFLPRCEHRVFLGKENMVSSGAW